MAATSTQRSHQPAAEAKGPSHVRRFLANFVGLLALLLWAGAALALVAGMPEFSVAIVVVNVVFSYFQEHRADLRADESTLTGEAARVAPEDNDDHGRHRDGTGRRRPRLACQPPLAARNRAVVKLLLIGIGFEVAMIALLAYTPGLDDIFHTSGLSVWHWLFLLAWPPLVLGADEARKARTRRKRSAADVQGVMSADGGAWPHAG